MSSTIQCTSCGVVLNLPPQAEGRRLKCPKCGTKFVVGDAGTGTAKPDQGGTSTNPASTILLTKKPSTGDIPVMPTAAGDLRETFDLPMMRDEAPAKTRPSGAAGEPAAADALALFQDEPAAPRKKTGAEARAQARRCPTCSGVVPVGMSVCQTCGLDLESGTRVDLDEDLAPPPPPAPTMPIPVGVIGGLALVGSIVGVIAALILWLGGLDGGIYFVPLALFGTFAAVQFLRGKSVKLLLVALTLAALIDLAALVALPIYEAQSATDVVQVKDVGDDPNSAGVAIRPISERLDTQKITTGFVLFGLYAAVSIYLLSPQVSRHLRK